MLSFQTWNHSNRWLKMFFFDVHIVMQRVYISGYKWTPFFKVTKFKIWSGTERNKINAQ